MALMMLVGTSSAWGVTLYLKPNNNWLNNTNRYSAYFFGNGEKWVPMTAGPEDKMYHCEAPAGYTKVIFNRADPNISNGSFDTATRCAHALEIVLAQKHLSALFYCVYIYLLL
jgi:hypothetical protein